MAEGLLVDLWGTLFWPSLPIEEYHMLRARILADVLAGFGYRYGVERVFQAYREARRLADAIRDASLHEVDVAGEAVIFLEKLGLEPRREVIEALEEAYLEPYLSKLTLAPGAQELLESVHRMGLKVALASNTMSGWHTAMLLRKSGLLGYFDYLGLSDEIGFRKPHPRFFSAIISATGINPSRSVMVGDEEADIRGAKSFGFTTVAYTGFHEYEGSVEPDYTARSMREVGEILEELVARRSGRKA